MLTDRMTLADAIVHFFKESHVPGKKVWINGVEGERIERELVLHGVDNLYVPSSPHVGDRKAYQPGYDFSPTDLDGKLDSLVARHNEGEIGCEARVGSPLADYQPIPTGGLNHFEIVQPRDFDLENAILEQTDGDAPRRRLYGVRFWLLHDAADAAKANDAGDVKLARLTIRTLHEQAAKLRLGPGKVRDRRAFQRMIKGAGVVPPLTWDEVDEYVDSLRPRLFREKKRRSRKD